MRQGRFIGVPFFLKQKKSLPFGFSSGATARLNIANNINRLTETQTLDLDPIRSNEEDFANERVSLDRLYSSWIHSFSL